MEERELRMPEPDSALEALNDAIAGRLMRTSQRMARLQAVTASLSGALTSAEVADVVLHQGLSAMEAAAGAIYLLDEDRTSLVMLSSTGYGLDVVEARKHIPLTAPMLVAAAVRDEHPIFLESIEAWAEARQEGVATGFEGGYGAGAAVLLAVNDQVIGAMGLNFSAFRRYDEEDRAFMQALAQQCAQALERARLYDAEREAIKRLQFLLDASTTLASSLDHAEGLRALARLAITALADLCLIDIVDETGQIRRVAARHADPDKQRMTDILEERYAPGTSGLHPVARVIRTGQAEYRSEMADDFLRATTQDADHYQLVRELGFTSYMSVPLVARGRILGAITLVSSGSGHRYGARDLELGEDLARRAAIMVDNARLYQEQQAALRQRDEFFSIASHELKTPLTALQLQVQMLERSARSGETLEAERVINALQVIDRQTERFSRLINDLLDLTRLASGKLELAPTTTNLVDVTREVIDRATAQANVEGYVITLQAPEAVIGRWDRLRIDQVVTNLVSNAIKYGNREPIDISVSRRESVARLDVHDSGPGISHEDEARIFERFERGSDAGAGGGLGLGLYIAHQIVEAHGGRIGVESKRGPDSGTTFHVELPLGEGQD